MTDRELLEFAAKAAEIIIKDSTRWTNTVVRQVTLDDGNCNWIRWNPITDDGDALRLAVKCGIDVMHTNIHSPQVHAMADHDVACIEDSTTDPYAATRRAIVRAAAGIGRSKK